MKAIIKLIGDNGSVPPTYYHQYALTFFDNGKVRFEIFDDREQGKTILDEVYNYNKGALDNLTEQLPQIKNSATTANYNVGAETKQIIDYQASIPVIYNISMEDIGGQRLFDQLLTLCHTNLVNRINQLFFK